MGMASVSCNEVEGGWGVALEVILCYLGMASVSCCEVGGCGASEEILCCYGHGWWWGFVLF